MEDESRQLLSELADADRKRLDERRRQVMIMTQKREAIMRTNKQPEKK